MRKYLIDTNCILRYLLNDIPDQAQTVEDYLKSARSLEITAKIPVLVFVEIDFILTRLYGFPKNKVVENINNILCMKYLDIEKRDMLKVAMKLYISKNISFVDAIFCTQAELEGLTLLTFDKKLRKIKF